MMALSECSSGACLSFLLKQEVRFLFVILFFSFFCFSSSSLMSFESYDCKQKGCRAQAIDSTCVLPRTGLRKLSPRSFLKRVVSLARVFEINVWVPFQNVARRAGSIDGFVWIGAMIEELSHGVYTKRSHAEISLAMTSVGQLLVVSKEVAVERRRTKREGKKKKGKAMRKQQKGWQAGAMFSHLRNRLQAKAF